LGKGTVILLSHGSQLSAVSFQLFDEQG